MPNRQPVTEDDIGAPVIDTDEVQVATVVGVGEGTVDVQPEPDLGDDARGRGSIGWDDPEDTYAFDATAFERVESSAEPTFRVDLGELRGGEAADEHVASGRPEQDETRGTE